MDNEIKFGFWNYLPVGSINKNIVEKWVDLNCNLFMSFRFLKGKSEKKEMIELLDDAQKYGCKVLINDERVEYQRLNEMSKEEYTKQVEEAVKDFGYHPATFGFYFGDEPNSKQEENFCLAASLLKKLLPNKIHYGNLLPYWSGFLSEPEENNQEDQFYFDKINRIIKDGNLDILAFDQYTQCYDETRDQKEGVVSFINAVRNFYKVAKDNNIPLYVSTLSVGHFRYREPSEKDIRWQINVSTALGAKGIIWFYFHQIANDPGYFNPPFLGERAYITPIYGMIQRQQYSFNERYRKIMDQIQIEDIKFRSTLYFKEDQYKEDKTIVDRFDVLYKDKLAIVSVGRYVDNPNHKVLLVTNADQNVGNAFSIYFKNGKECHFELSPGEIRIFDLD